MGRCWANSLGGCDTMSGEHIFSDALFTRPCSCPMVTDGVKRIRRGEPTPNAEKANILCRHHNSTLTELDQLAGKIANFQARANDEHFEDTLYVEGELLERWLLKTVVNVAAAGWAAPRKWHPSPEIVAAIFGHTPVPNGVGLFSVDGVDRNLRPQGGVSFTPILLNQSTGPQLLGAYVTVHGMPLFAALDTELVAALESSATPSLSRQFSDDGLRHIYRPGAIIMSRKRGRPAIIGLSWNGLLHFADGTTAPIPVQ